MQRTNGCCVSAQIGVEFGTKIISLGNRQIKLQPVPQGSSESGVCMCVVVKTMVPF